MYLSGSLDMVDFSPDPSSIVQGHKVCQTKNAKWLSLEDIYQKCHRPNDYDIGGTYIEDVADYWFRYKVEQVGDIFLLHLFVENNRDSTFTIAASNNNHLNFDEKRSVCWLTKDLRPYYFEDVKSKSQTYITTYNFREFEIDLLKNKTLFIAVSFIERCLMKEKVIDDLRYSHDFGALLADPVGSDFTVESEDGEKFEVHKILLATQSDYFKAMLKEETAESQNNYVKLVGVNKEDLKCMLEFIYCGTINDIGNANWISLLMLSDLYNLNGLRELSQHAISLQLSKDNALEILSIADMSNSHSLKLTAMKFIKKNVDIIKSNTFSEINNPGLLKELCLLLAD